MARAPGEVKRAILKYLRERPDGAPLRDIHAAVVAQLGGEVAASSVRSFLRLNSKRARPDVERVEYGHYRLVRR